MSTCPLTVDTSDPFQIRRTRCWYQWTGCARIVAVQKTKSTAEFVRRTLESIASAAEILFVLTSRFALNKTIKQITLIARQPRYLRVRKN